MGKIGHGLRVAGLLSVFLLAASAARAQPAQPSPESPSLSPSASMPLPAAAPPLEPAAELPPPPPATPQVALADRVVVSPGATCLERERLLRRIERWLERGTVDDDLRIDVRGDTRDEYEVVFTVRKGPGPGSERRIDEAPEDCGQLHAAVALSIALAIDAAIADASAPPLELPEDEELVEVPELVTPPYLRLGLGLLGQASSGVLSGVAVGAAGRIEVGFVPWLDVRGGLQLAAISDERIGSIDGTFSAELLTGRLDACAAFDVAAKARLLGCVGALVGRFRTKGQGFSPSEEQSEVWVAVVGGLEAQVQAAPWLAFALALDVLLPTAKRTIQALGVDGEVEDDRTVSTAGFLVSVGPVFQTF